jgi:hypothetical protein
MLAVRRLLRKHFTAWRDTTNEGALDGCRHDDDVFASYGWDECSDVRVWEEEIRLARLAADLGFDCLPIALPIRIPGVRCP